MYKKIFILIFLLLIVCLFNVYSVQAEDLAQRLSGKILLQTEGNGEAWYVNPLNLQRIYLKDGAAAYKLMRELGLGITDANLSKIPVGIESRFKDTDTDSDGLSNQLEEGLKTDPNIQDTDDDGYNDYTEITGSYNPLGSGKLSYDSKLIGSLRGRILLQVESKGEAWYLNPGDGKRYYMKDGDAAYQIMRYLSLGITDDDLSKISIANSDYIADDTDSSPDYNCQENEDCSQTCVGCEDGKQSCVFEMDISSCKDCFSDLMCNDGYKCKADTCVKWECDDYADCHDNNPATKDICTNYKCSHTPVTQCINNDFYCPASCTATNDNDCGGSKCSTGIIDCGAASSVNDCYINAARNCCPAKLVSSAEIDLFGMLVSSKTNREIKGIENERCVEYGYIVDSHVDLTDAARQEALANGTTEEELDQGMAETNQMTQKQIGTDSTCRYPLEYFISNLEEEKSGNFTDSSDRTEKYQCTGSLYEIEY